MRRPGARGRGRASPWVRRGSSVLTPPAGAVFLYTPAGAGTTGWTNEGSAGASADLAAIGTAAALSTLDGKTVVDFSGASAGFGCPSTAFELGAGHTIFVVARTPSSFAAARRVLSGGVSAAGAGTSIIQCSTTPRWQLQTTDFGTSAPGANTWYALCAQWDVSGVSESLFVNDFSTPLATTPASGSTCTGVTLGSHSTGATDWLGRVAFAAGYSGHSVSLSAMRAYLLQQFPSLTIA